MIFPNRERAGQLLGKQLKYFSTNPLILIALPRGGVPVGYEVAKILHIPLNILVVRKLGIPFHKEYGMGAVTEQKFYWVNRITQLEAGISDGELKKALELENREISKRVKLFRKGLPLIKVKGETVIVIDDGLATGVTARVACQYLRKQGAKTLILGIPVGSQSSIKKLSEIVDQVVCLETPHPFFAVSDHYQHFDQLTNHDVIGYLDRRNQEWEQELKTR